MIKIGMIIGDRYEILEKIGTGGMSDVYKAKDEKLGRFVAVKVLKQEFSENANFVSKFRTEAQAAAGLMHPNIVNVYDVGEENGIYYIVMELVEGITLKKYIEKKVRLTVKEAISIAIQVSMGIESAHNNHIIHRDIKPQNIIISKEGKVKVTDFGIAKAASSNTITSNVMGSVHYTSPEQARGGYSNEKSDIYSLGITLFEMLTGSVPFNGDTTVAIAIKHIQEDAPSPKDFVPDIPISVEKIVAKCLQKSPDKRYQNMAALIADLKQSLINPDADFVKPEAAEREAGTRLVTEAEKKAIKKNTHSSQSSESKTKSGEKSGKKKVKNSEPEQSMRLKKDVKLAYSENLEDDEDEDYDPRMEHITTILAVVAAVLIGLIILFVAGRTLGLFGSSSKNVNQNEEEVLEEEETLEMVDLIGKNLDEAKSTLLSMGLTPEVTYEENDSIEANIVLATDPAAGSYVAMGENVILTVSMATGGVEVPDVSGKTESEAQSVLEKAGFLVVKTENYDMNTPKGSVISQSPEAGAKAPEGSTITLHISLGNEDNKVMVPNVIGLSEMDAMTALVEAGLTVGSVTEVNNDDITLKDLVCFQSYAVGTYLDKDTAIDLRVSIGPVTGTYSYSGSIEAPTQDEDKDYRSGTDVTVVFTTEDGTSLMSTTTSTFPITVNYTGIKSASGTITMTYTVVISGGIETDPETGEEYVVEDRTEEHSITRQISFVQE